MVLISDFRVMRETLRMILYMKHNVISYCGSHDVLYFKNFASFSSHHDGKIYLNLVFIKIKMILSS